ncbi:MAG: hypothetical protein V3W18_02160 [candidate division Zixibacteria bacterium]
MKGKIKTIALVVIALGSFVGYTYVFAMVLGVDTGDAISVLTTGTVPLDFDLESDETDSLGFENPEESEEVLMSKADSLDRQLTIINAARTDLESLKLEVEGLLETKKRKNEEQLNDLAKIYDGMNPIQLAEVMTGMNDSLVVEILPRMKRQKVSKILESMPPERAAVISAMLLGGN